MKPLWYSLGLIVILGHSSHGQTSEQLIQEGRAFLVSSNLTAAKLKFEMAVRANPTNELGNALLGLTRLAAFAETEEAGRFLTLAGVTNVGRSVYNWTALPPLDTNDVPLVPVNPFGGNDVKDFARRSVGPELAATAANLGAITNRLFVMQLTKDETKIGSVNIDYGDLQLIKSFLHLAEFSILTTSGWDVNLQASVVREISTNETATVEGLLRRFPGLGTFESVSDLPAARQALQQSINTYLEASSFIRRRPTTELRLFNYDPEAGPDEEQFSKTLLEIKSSIDVPTVSSYDSNYTFFAKKIFEFPEPPRQWIPTFLGNDVMAGTLPNPVGGGVVLGLDRGDVENFITGPARTGRFTRVYPTLLSYSPELGHIQFTGIDRQPYELQASSNLLNWITLGKNIATNGRVTFANLPQPSNTAFYRLRDLVTQVSIRGRVIGLPQMSPISSAFVTFRITDELTNRERTFSTVSDSFGNFIIETDAEWPDFEGYYYLTVTSPGYPEARTEGISLPSVNKDVFLAQRPPNDDFYQASSLAGFVTSSLGWNIGATQDAGNYAVHSVWFTWTAPKTGAAVVEAIGTGFRPHTSVMVGSTIATITWATEGRSQVDFSVTEGTTYRICISGGWDDHQQGWFNLQVKYVPAPANDLFNNRQLITGNSAFIRAPRFGATTDIVNGKQFEAGVWFTWTAPTNKPYRVSIGDSWAVVKAFTGDSAMTLFPITDSKREIHFQALSGQSYHFCVSGYGTESFLLRLEPLSRPENDLFSQRFIATGAYFSDKGSNFECSKEDGEPLHGFNTGGRSVWWEWTCTQRANTSIRVTPHGFEPLLSVYKGPSLGQLTAVAVGNYSSALGYNQAVFDAQPGVTYFVAVDGKDGDAGDFDLFLGPPGLGFGEASISSGKIQIPNASF